PRNRRKLLWSIREWANSSSHHHPPRSELLPVRQTHQEAPSVLLQPGHMPKINIGHRPPLIPEPVVDKAFQRNRLLEVVSISVSEGIEIESSVGVGNVRRFPIRAQKHPRWHLPRPERHRRSEYADLNTTRA